MPVAALNLEQSVRLPGTAAWPPARRAYGGEKPNRWKRYLWPFRVAARLFLPVMLLTVLLGAAFLYSDDALLLPGAPAWLLNGNLVMSDLVLPMAWTAIHLTNRRYGANYAFAQLMLGLGLVAAIAVAPPYDVDHWFAMTPVLTWRALAAFGVFFVLANLVGIILFEAVRGPDWWPPPLVASFGVSLVFSLFYYPAAFAGLDLKWANASLVHFALFMGTSLFLLAPYGLMRPAMRPLHGMNGY